MCQSASPGKIVLFGSGETSATGRAVHDLLLAEFPAPVAIAILETPAGFQPNSALVAGEIKDFFEAHLSNYRPQVSIVPARKRDSAFNPDDPALLKPLLDAHYIFMGPGSPTYAVRHLQGTLAWRYLRQRHQEGACLALSSAGALAAGSKVLPVYEIFKAGAEPHWADGLDLFGSYGLDLAIVPHWDNADGGPKLDTSRCFMGAERMAQLRTLLPPTTTVLGIDEHTAAIFDLHRGRCSVRGKGGVTILAPAAERRWAAGEEHHLTELGRYMPPDFVRAPAPGPAEPELLPRQVARLVAQREAARRRRDWARADALRAQVARMGFELTDAKEGVRWRYLRKSA